jgi:hypothetical protein
VLEFPTAICLAFLTVLRSQVNFSSCRCLLRSDPGTSASHLYGVAPRRKGTLPSAISCTGYCVQIHCFLQVDLPAGAVPLDRQPPAFSCAIHVTGWVRTPLRRHAKIFSSTPRYTQRQLLLSFTQRLPGLAPSRDLDWPLVASLAG